MDCYFKVVVTKTTTIIKGNKIKINCQSLSIITTTIKIVKITRELDLDRFFSFGSHLINDSVILGLRLFIFSYRLY